MLKTIVWIVLLASTTIAQSRPPIQVNNAEVTVETAVKTDDGTDVDASAKQSLQAQFRDAKLLEKLVKCAPTGRHTMFAVVQIGKKKSRAISTGRTKQILTCIESALGTVTGDELTATVRVLLDPRAAQQVPRGKIDI
jgi:hypothetical protein